MLGMDDDGTTSPKPYSLPICYDYRNSHLQQGILSAGLRIRQSSSPLYISNTHYG